MKASRLIPRPGIRSDGAGEHKRPAVAPRPRRRLAVLPEGSEPSGVLRRDTHYRRLLATADVLSAGASIFVGLTVIGDNTFRPSAVLALPLVALICKAIGLYDRDQHLVRKTTLDELPSIWKVTMFYSVVLWFANPLLIVRGELTREQVLGLWVLLFLTMAIGRLAARLLARGLSAPERCLIVGDAAAAARLRRAVEESPSIKATIVGRVRLNEAGGEGPNALNGQSVAAAFSNGQSAAAALSNGHNGTAVLGNGRKRERGVPVVGTVDMLGLAIAEHDIDRVIVAPDGPDSDEVLDVIRLVKSLGVHVSLLPRLFEVVGSSVEFDDVDGVMLLGVRRYGLTRSSEALKRSVDIAGSIVCLVLVAPLLALIAIAIKLSSPGPVFFRQPRIGRAGREFVMLKFRTMVVGADALQAELALANEADGLFKIADDPRLTSAGRFLRRTALDELPQLINVLRAEMSLVGPRPLVPHEDRRVEGWQRRRLLVTPGMTGLWQVFGSSRVPLQEMVKIDYLYGANWSLWLDLKILLRTIPYAVGRRGL